MIQIQTQVECFFYFRKLFFAFQKHRKISAVIIGLCFAYWNSRTHWRNKQRKKRKAIALFLMVCSSWWRIRSRQIETQIEKRELYYYSSLHVFSTTT